MAVSTENRDWAFAIAYNAILQAIRALAFSKGYRPIGEAQHKTSVEILRIELGDNPAVEQINRMRRRRNRVVYNMSGLVSLVEVEEALRVANAMVRRIHALLDRELPEGLTRQEGAP